MTQSDELLADLVTHVIVAERNGRWVAAAIGLTSIRQCLRHGDDPRAWCAFVESHFPFSVDRAAQLIGKAVHHKGLMRCVKCGQQAVCECGCGAPYASDQPWATRVEPAEKPSAPTALQRAVAAIAAHPERSNRVIAQELGMGKDTVRRAREQHAPVDAPVEARTGADGRIRKLPHSKRIKAP